MRSGETTGLRAPELKAMSVGSNADGGYLVPAEVEQTIGQRLTAISPIRGIAGQRTISGNVYKKPFMTAGPAVGWVGETDARTPYRQNAVFVMNRKTQSTIRKFKDTAGNFLWQPPANAGGRATLMTFAVIEAEDMPDIAANSLSIAFGDFGSGYLIVDRAGVMVLRDPYSAKPYVLFYTTKRVGGGVQDFDAIKLMKFAAS